MSAYSAAFEHVCAELEAASSLTAIEARGTIRITLKKSGFDARHVTSDEIKAVVMKALAPELEARGITAPAVIERLTASLTEIADLPVAESPAAIFRELGRD